MSMYFTNYKIQGTESEKLEKIRFLLACLFIFFLPYEHYYSTTIFYLFIGTLLIDFKVSKIKRIPKQVWVFQLIFLLSVVGYVSSNYKHEAGSFVERQLMIFLFPIVLPMAFDITKERIKSLLYTLVINSFCIVIILYAYVFYQMQEQNLPINDLFTKPFLNHNFSQPIGIHASYLSFYLSVGFLFLLQELILVKQIKSKILITIVMLCLLLSLFSLIARSILLAFFVVLIIVVPIFFFKTTKDTLKYFVLLVPVLVVGVFFVRNSIDIGHRVLENVVVDLGVVKGNVQDNIEQIEPRAERWKLGIDLVKQKPLLGHGTGSELPLLKEEYLKKKLMISYYENFNSHNGYLSILIKHGITGLIVFLFAFFYYVRLAIVNRSFIYFSFLLTLLVFLLVENVLDRQVGIFFFALLNTLFGYYFLNQQQDDKIVTHE